MLLILVCSIIIIICDQLTKYFTVHNIALNHSVTLIDNVLNLTHVHNKGAAWNILNNQVDILIIISGIAISYFCMIAYKHRHRPKYKILIYGLVIGGSVGNLIDRIFLGYVVDMIDVSFINFPIFNFADICISIGMVCIIIMIMLYGEETIL